MTTTNLQVTARKGRRTPKTSRRPITVELEDGPVSLREFAERHGLAYRTVHKRWQIGTRAHVLLARPADQRYARRRRA